MRPVANQVQRECNGSLVARPHERLAAVEFLLASDTVAKPDRIAAYF
jgi:hypothetical protein